MDHYYRNPSPHRANNTFSPPSHGQRAGSSQNYSPPQHQQNGPYRNSSGGGYNGGSPPQSRGSPPRGGPPDGYHHASPRHGGNYDNSSNFRSQQQQQQYQQQPQQQQQQQQQYQQQSQQQQQQQRQYPRGGSFEGSDATALQQMAATNHQQQQTIHLQQQTIHLQQETILRQQETIEQMRLKIEELSTQGPTHPQRSPGMRVDPNVRYCNLCDTSYMQQITLQHVEGKRHKQHLQLLLSEGNWEELRRQREIAVQAGAPTPESLYGPDPSGTKQRSKRPPLFNEYE